MFTGLAPLVFSSLPGEQDKYPDVTIRDQQLAESKFEKAF